MKKNAEHFFRFLFFIIAAAFLLSGCDSFKSGRVSVILDNSSSMESAGTSFDEIKQSLFEALSVLPGSYESGLRVFDDAQSGTRLVAPYSRDLSALRSQLGGIYPSTNTYMAQALLDIANDLKGIQSKRLFFVTDGIIDRGSSIEAARMLKLQAERDGGSFECHFLIFSDQTDAWNNTPIGEVANTLGCQLSSEKTRLSASSLMPELLRVFGVDFYFIWIILSALAYIAMVFLTAYLIFDTQIAQGVRAKVAKTVGTGFVFGLLPAVMGAHLIGLFSGISGIIFGVTLLSLGFVAIAMIGIGKGRKRSKYDSDDSDPFK